LPAENGSITDKHEEAEIYIPQKDIWVAVSADPVKDDDQVTSHFVHIIRDITYRKQAEQTLAKLNSDLQKTVEELQKSKPGTALLRPRYRPRPQIAAAGNRNSLKSISP